MLKISPTYIFGRRRHLSVSNGEAKFFGLIVIVVDISVAREQFLSIFFTYSWRSAQRVALREITINTLISTLSRQCRR